MTGFLSAIEKADLPQIINRRAKDLLTRCRGNGAINASEIDWLVKALGGVDLGGEGPWLRGYLEAVPG